MLENDSSIAKRQEMKNPAMCKKKYRRTNNFCIGGIFMTLSLLVRQSYYYGTADSGIVSVLSACIFETAE